ncbi:WD40-repeat-containing domain protein [Entophlyctis helioformis]|nr:WD40-repeat-containing domain protein [Entophlyctis helioformis]
MSSTRTSNPTLSTLAGSTKDLAEQQPQARRPSHSGGGTATPTAALKGPLKARPPLDAQVLQLDSGEPAVMLSSKDQSKSPIRPMSSAPKRVSASPATQTPLPVDATFTFKSTPKSLASPSRSRTSTSDAVPVADLAHRPTQQPNTPGTPAGHSRQRTIDSLKYDDDFDTYDGDGFEPFDEPVESLLPEPSSAPAAAAPRPSDLDDLQRAMAEENARVALGQPIYVPPTPVAHDYRYNRSPSRGTSAGASKNLSGSRSGGMIGSHDRLDTMPTKAAVSSSSSSSLARVASSNLPQRQTVDLKAAQERSERERNGLAMQQNRIKRAKDLANLIDLDFMFYDIFDLSPLNEYELYVRNYGISNAAQAQTQTGDDGVERETQTDDWDVQDRWVQASPGGTVLVECGVGVPALPWLGWAGGQRGSAGASGGSGASGGGADAQRDELKAWAQEAFKKSRRGGVAAAMGMDSVRLVRFLRRSSQVMDILLEENAEEFGVDGSSSFGGIGTFEFSRGFAELNVPPWLEGQAIADMCFTPGDYRSLLIAWKGVSKPFHPSFPTTQGVLLVWRLNDPTRPYRMLVCESQITCCCFAPTKPYFVFAGTKDGSIQMWDLRELPGDHVSVRLGSGKPGEDQTIVARVPSYSTDGVYTKQRVHEHAVSAIIPLHKYGSGAMDGSASPSTAPVADDESGSFQVATVDRSGAFQLWVVVEVRDSAAATEIDYGLRIGSRVKLMRSSHFQIQHPDRHAFTRDLMVSDCKFLRNNIDRFLVATDAGFVVQESRFRDRCHPRLFEPQAAAAIPSLLSTPQLARADAVTTIETCPHLPTLFLAGYTSGMIALFSTHVKSALMAWHTIKSGIHRLAWSPHRPAVFTALDVNGNLYVWDMLESEQDPRYVVASSVLSAAPSTSSSRQTRTPCHIACSPTAVSATSRASLQNLMAAASRGATLVIGFDDGSLQVHRLDPEMAEMAVDEEKEFETYIQGLVHASLSR